MSKDIIAFDYVDRLGAVDGQVRTVTIDGEPWFVARDVALILGYANPYDAVGKHCKGVANHYPLHTAGGTQNVRVISEPDLMRLIVSSKLPTAVVFERWVFEEVLPQIRRTGSYEVQKALPQSYGEALRMLADEVEAKAVLEAKILADEPKVVFADAVSASKQSILVGELAKLLRQNGVQLGQNRLFEWLRANGYLIGGNRSDRNIPTQRSMEAGWFEVKETTIVHSDGHTSISKTPKVTGKGQQYFIDLFLSAKAVA